MADADWRLKELVKALEEMDTPEKMMNFLEGILTIKELEEIPTRLQIVKMLKQGMPQHEIAEQLKIGIATVTRGSKELQKGNFKYIKA